MRKRKHQESRMNTDIKKLRTEVIDFSFNNSLESDSSVSLSILNTAPNVQSRQEKRKEAKLLKKARKQAFSQRKAIPTKEDFNKAKAEIALEVQNEIQLKRQKEEKKREKKEKRKQKERKKRQNKEKKQQEEEEIDAVKLRDDREIQDLEKKLHLNKRKSKTLPQSFMDDGLDYILDVVNADKLEQWANVADESDFEDELKERPDDKVGDDDLEEFGSDEEEDGLNDEDFDDTNYNSDESDEDNQNKSESVDMGAADASGGKMQKWEKLAEKIKEVVTKNTGKSKSIIKQRNVEETLDEVTDSDKSKLSKKKVSFAEDPVEKTITDSEISGSLEHTDSDSLLSGESNEDIDMQDLSNVPEMKDDISDFDNISDRIVDDVETGLKEDIYGRLRDLEGNIIKDNKGSGGGGSGAYIPPGKRAQMVAGTDEKRKIHMEKLRKQMKGLVNRASEANIQSVGSQIEELYLANSRADVNETLVSLVFDLCVSRELTPERLSMELMMLVAILHGNVGSEVGAHFLQNLVKRFDALIKRNDHSAGKELDNIVILLSHLYNFKVVHNVLLFDLLKLLTDRFQEKDVELLLLIVKNIGFTLRKDDPAGLKELIVNIQTKASSADGAAMRDESRIRFMLDVLMAIRNNNMKKIPNYDPEHLHHLQRLMKGFLRGGEFGDNQLHVTLQDLINAENKGKWWIVGSAWEGQGPKQPLQEKAGSSFVLHGIEISSKLQELAKKQRMNTDKRRTIFYVIMTSEDYIDAFEKLLRMGLKANQQQEIVIVILDCCLQEKTYNPFYAFLAQRFCEHHRSYQMSFQFSIWDRFKVIGDLSEMNRRNFGKLLTHLIINKSLSLSILKVVQFGTVEKSMVRLLKQVLSDLLVDYPYEKTEAVFARIAPLVKLKKLHEGLKLFMHHFLIGKKKDGQEVNPVLKERVELVEQVLSTSKGHML